jgi:hypothetical protein
MLEKTDRSELLHFCTQKNCWKIKLLQNDGSKETEGTKDGELNPPSIYIITVSVFISSL